MFSKRLRVYISTFDDGDCVCVKGSSPKLMRRGVRNRLAMALLRSQYGVQPLLHLASGTGGRTDYSVFLLFKKL